MRSACRYILQILPCWLLDGNPGGGTQASGTATTLTELLPCAPQLARCLEACNVPELTELHQFLLENPSGPMDMTAEATGKNSAGVDSPSQIELFAFELFRQLGLSIFGTVLDYVTLCQYGDQRCVSAAAHFQQLVSVREMFHARVAEIAKDYVPETGVRSPVLRVGHNLRSDLEGFMRDLTGLESGLKTIERSAVLIHTIGQRARKLSHHLGMHSWVRKLAVPGRGAPVLILHDEYGSWADMLRNLLGAMVRNSPQPLSMAEIGIPFQGWATPPVLLEFPSVQYLGIVLESTEEERPTHSVQEQLVLFEQLRAEAQTAGLGQKRPAALHLAASSAATDALPANSLDLVVLHVRDGSVLIKDLQRWQEKIKPGGVLAGTGFDPRFPSTVQAICDQRFSNDLNLGAGGGFWWLVEPEEEEERQDR